MKNLASSVFVSMMTFLVSTSSQPATTGTGFQEITDNNNNGHDIFNEFFHRCSFTEQCNFIVNDLKANTFKEVSDEKDLPADKNVHAIWKKISKGNWFSFFNHI